MHTEIERINSAQYASEKLHGFQLTIHLLPATHEHCWRDMNFYWDRDLHTAAVLFVQAPDVHYQTEIPCRKQQTYLCDDTVGVKLQRINRDNNAKDLFTT